MPVTSLRTGDAILYILIVAFCTKGGILFSDSRSLHLYLLEELMRVSLSISMFQIGVFVGLAICARFCSEVDCYTHLLSTFFVVTIYPNITFAWHILVSKNPMIYHQLTFS